MWLSIFNKNVKIIFLDPITSYRKNGFENTYTPVFLIVKIYVASAMQPER